MTARLFYVDESFDSDKFCLSAIGIRHSEWRECFQRVRQHRTVLKEDFGIFMRKELHSHQFVGGRGRVSDRIIGKHDRSRIFEGLLRLVAQLPNVMVINICLDRKGRNDVQLDAWDRLMNRIERTMLAFEERELPLRRDLLSEAAVSMSDQRKHQLDVRLNLYRPVSLILADQGREPEITRALRKMSVYNPIPSMVGDWGGGVAAKNIPVQRVIEDPVFKRSHQSYFIQLADAVAYALLKREVAPTPHARRYGIDKVFDRTLTGVCYRPASKSDRLESFGSKRATRRWPSTVGELPLQAGRPRSTNCIRMRVNVNEKQYCFLRRAGPNVTAEACAVAFSPAATASDGQ